MGFSQQIPDAVPIGIRRHRKARQSFALKWWAAAPTLIWFAILAVYVWPSEPHRTLHSISLFMARIAGGIILSVFFGWLFFRVLDNSRLAGSMVYSFFCLLFTFSEVAPALNGAVHHAGSSSSNTAQAGETPSQLLAFPEQPQLQLNGQFAVNYPIGMQPLRSPDPTRAVAFGLPSSTGKTSVFGVVLYIGQFPRGTAFKDAEDAMTPRIQREFKLTKPLQWHGVPSAHWVDITDPTPSAADAADSCIIYGIAGFARGQYVLANASIYTKDPAEIAKYADIFEKIVKSVSIPN